MSQLDQTRRRQPLLGSSAIALAILFNAPYAVLAASFDYPQVLRQPAGAVLDRFAAGGPALVLTWYGFALAALALTPMAPALSLSTDRLRRAPVLAIGAALAGALAGVTQAMGLMRWVFVVPGLARDHLSPDAGVRAGAEQGFNLLNAFGGVAIGEHLGQLLTALFVLLLALVQAGEGRRPVAGLGLCTAAAIALGTGEGLAMALGGDGGLFSLATIAGFLGLTAWLIATGAGLFTAPSRRA
jgi:hypothetical protein